MCNGNVYSILDSWKNSTHVHRLDRDGGEMEHEIADNVNPQLRMLSAQTHTHLWQAQKALIFQIKMCGLEALQSVWKVF